MESAESAPIRSLRNPWRPVAMSAVHAWQVEMRTRQPNTGATESYNFLPPLEVNTT